MEPLTVGDVLAKIPFSVASIAEVCCDPGSYRKELAIRTALSIRKDVEWMMDALGSAKNTTGEATNEGK